MLSHENTLLLLDKAKTGDENAKQVLVEENSPLIKSVIRRFVKKGVEYDDLYQLGCLGFLKAIKNFDVSFGVKFSTYAVPMVIGEIKRFMRDDGSVKVSRAIKGLNLKIGKFVELYEQQNSKKPTIEEIAKQFGIDVQEVVFTMDSNKMPISIYAPAEDDSKNQFLIDHFTKLNDNDEIANSLLLKDALSSLGKRDKRIILLRFFRDMTQSEIAKELGVSQVQVSRLENKILEKLKAKIQ